MLRKLFRRKSSERHIYELDDVVQTASQGRRLAIYDRETNVYAYWYLELRAGEEVMRARRYGKPLSVLSLWAQGPSVITGFAGYLREHLRDNDLAGYLNNGHFVVVLPETAIAGGEVVLGRALSAFPAAVEGAAVAYPEDGSSFDELLDIAKRRISNPDQRRRA